MSSQEKLRILASQIVTERTVSEGLQRFVYSGKCMSPILRDGNLVFVETISPERLSLGDIVVFEDKGTHYIHRFLYQKKDAQGRPRIFTKADDSLKLDAPLEFSLFVGRAVEIKARNKRISLKKNHLRLISFLIGGAAILEAAGAGLFNRIHLGFVFRGPFLKFVQKAVQFPKWILQKLFAGLL